MGFWSGLTKMVQGKPVFEATERSTSTTIHSANVKSEPVRSVPEVTLENCESRVSGSDMTVTAWVTNQSTEEIELDKTVILGSTVELNRIFSPGQAREEVLFKGKVAPNDSYHTANLYYKRRSDGNYFCADFRLEYDYDTDGFYTIEEFHPIRPIRDV